MADQNPRGALIQPKMLLLPSQHAPQPSLARISTSSIRPLPQRQSSPSSLRTPRTDAERWAVLTTRHPAYANAFIYAVLTTKIYCRPNCPSRLARRANVEFFASSDEAVMAGYRPCKRCKPDQGKDVEDDGVEKVRKAVEVIKERAEQGEKISLAELSKEVGLSKWHLQRAFKKRIGVSPREMGESLEKEQQEADKGKEREVESQAELGSEVEGEGEMLFALSTPGSSEEGLTDSKSSDVSSLPTPLPFDTMTELDDMSWLTGCPADTQQARASSFSHDRNFANTTDFDPEVEKMIRDLFPEIYSDAMTLDLRGS